MCIVRLCPKIVWDPCTQKPSPDLDYETAFGNTVTIHKQQWELNDPLSGVTVARIRMLPNTMAVLLTKKAEKMVTSKKQTYCLTSEVATVSGKTPLSAATNRVVEQLMCRLIAV
ncbi:unnamed protein product [Taenia asiatica]|uniref:RanBD1 domain-containing protein n=1 Tax=Taenia asiatica TaxID=60517 RepID=A0A0R3W0E2_TAEAS|nr:unnamed protein product [Taenia asiatica]